MTGFLYVHIPFCARKCLYCDFLSIPFDEALAKSYIHTLCRELALRRNDAAALKTVFIGGGTPSILSSAMFTTLFACIRDQYSLAPSAEITVEVNPGTVSPEGLGSLASLGVNRISMGVQSLDDVELSTLGRLHTAEEALRSAEMIREAGFENFSVDLMYGIPGQTTESWRRTLSHTGGLGPKHVSAYELTPEPGTPLARMLAAGEVSLPGEDIVTEMFRTARYMLSHAGFEHYEISNYAVPGFRCLHNLNYWERGEYIGAGAGAHSFVDGIRSRNVGDIRTYIDLLRRGASPMEESAPVSPDEAKRELIFLGLRKTGGISLRVTAALGMDIGGTCADLIEEGFLDASRGAVRFTAEGMVLSNELLVKIFQRLGL